MQLATVPPHLLPDARADFDRWLAPVVAQPGCDFSLPDLASLVEREEAMLAAVLDAEGRAVALGVTQVREHESGLRSAWVLALGGRRIAPWSDVLREIEDGARRNGCSSVEFVGRPAWRRLVPRYRAEPCELGTHYSLDLRH